MKLMIPLLLLLTACHAGAQDKEPSHYVLHAESGDFNGGQLVLHQVEKKLAYYTPDQQTRAGTMDVSDFIDKTFSNLRPVSFTANDSVIPLKIKKLRYNPYNEKLVIELEAAPFERGTSFKHVTLIFY